MHSPNRTFHGRPPFKRLLPFLKPGFHHVRSHPKVGTQGKGLFLPVWWKQPLGSLLQNSAHVWAYVILQRRYLGTPEEIIRGGTASE